MTVKQLKILLHEHPDDAIVVISRDAEGNGHSPLSQVYPGKYYPFNTWSGEFYGEDDVRDGQQCVALFPVN